MEPPDPLPNSVVKRVIADGSVGCPHVRVGHCQAPNKQRTPVPKGPGVFCLSGAMPYCALQRVHVTNRCTNGAGLDVGYANARRVRTSVSDHCRSLTRTLFVTYCRSSSPKSKSLPTARVGSDRRSDPLLLSEFSAGCLTFGLTPL